MICILTFNFDKGAFWSGVAVAGTGPWGVVQRVGEVESNVKRNPISDISTQMFW